VYLRRRVWITDREPNFSINDFRVISLGTPDISGSRPRQLSSTNKVSEQNKILLNISVFLKIELAAEQYLP
jgi:hypothetical protein